VLTHTKKPRDTLHHTQSSLCCAQSWTMSVIDRRRLLVECGQHLAMIVIPS